MLRRADVLGLVVVVAVVAAAAVIPLAFNPQFYFFADTPDGAFGQWFELGQQLRNGVWPIMRPEGWAAGNYVVEGQWGLWNPLVLATALFASAAPSAVVSASVVKIAYLVIGAAGVYSLTRVFGGTVRWAVLAGVASAFTGFTLFMDASSWATNQSTWALFVWAVVGLEMWVRRGAWWGLAAFATAYLLITTGYVQGTLMLVFYYAAALIHAAVVRSGPRALRLLVSGLAAAGVAVLVFLPGILSLASTNRAAGISNNAFMVVTLTSLGSMIVPSANSDMLGWWGRFTEVPLGYVAWFLPLVALADVRALWARWKPVLPLAIFGAFALMLAVGPSEVGPLRFPARTMPWIATTLIVLVALSLSYSTSRLRFTPLRLVSGGVLVGGAFWLAFAQSPQSWHRHIFFMAVVSVALVLMAYTLRREAGLGRWGLALALAASVGILGVQAKLFAPMLQSRIHYPDSVSDFNHSMPTGHGTAITVGSPLGLPAAAFNEINFANMWYLTDTASVMNLYSTVGSKNFNADLCMGGDGITCYKLADTLFAKDPATGKPLVDLLGIDSIQFIANADHSVGALEKVTPPIGWTRSYVGQYSVVWTRNADAPANGGVVWQSSGVDAQVVSNTDLEVTVRVDAVPSSGGKLVFSRIAWPGYATGGGALAAPVRGYLLTVDVPANAAGKTITVSFAPPGWMIALIALALSIVIAIGMSGASFWRARAVRRRQHTPLDPLGLEATESITQGDSHSDR